MRTSHPVSRFYPVLVLVAFSVALGGGPRARADETIADSSAPTYGTTNRSDRIDVKALREKYWAKGEQSELRVVRNRTYTKSGKVEVGGFLGITNTNPFLNVKNLGLSLGYNFTEYLGVEVDYWHYSVSASSAAITFENETTAEGTPHVADSNDPKDFIGAELLYSPIYGKLSLFGSTIIYYDLHLLGGAGETSTEAGTYFTPIVGIGQQIWLTKQLSLRLDFRETYYRETVLAKTLNDPQVPFLSPVGSNNNFSNIISLGFTYLFEI